MSIWKATKNYESWLAKFVRLISADLDLKHRNMASDVFTFLRGTFYWWALVWRKVCPELADAPEVLAVGDLHVENFGSWRDFLARQIWGINDFDEACFLPYTNDLLRLATSALLALESNRFKQLTPEQACKAILDGYRRGIKTGGRPFVLDQHPELERMLTSTLRDPQNFWEKFERLRQTHSIAKRSVQPDALAALKGALPEPGLAFSIVHRIAGQGSLGRPRYTLLADWRGGPIALEAKSMAPSATVFASGSKSKRTYYMQIIDNAVRCQDPFIAVVGNQLLRRLAPDCSRIELSTLGALKDERLLLESMGFEAANVHLGTPGAQKKILADLDGRPAEWLTEGAEKMAKKMRRGQKQFARKHAQQLVAISDGKL